MDGFKDNRSNDLEPEIQKIEEEIDEQFKQLGDDIRVSQFLKLLDLRPLKVLVHRQYTSKSMIETEPMAYANLLVYKEIRGIQQKSALTRQVRNHLDIAEDLGFNLTQIPGSQELRRFERERVNPEIRNLIKHTANYIQENCSSKLVFGLEKKNRPAIVEENTTNREENEEDEGRDWSAYNEAQTSEKPMFKRMMHEISKTVHQHKKRPSGRTGYSIQDQLFCLALHQYTGKSSRRLSGELQEAAEQGYIEEAPHFNTVLNFYDEAGLHQLLQTLVTLTAKPLDDIERDIAVDASGYGTSQYEQWESVKYNRPDEQKKFLKVHIGTGVRTNTITAVEVTDGTNHDSPEFEKIIEQTAKHFEIREVSADKAYSSRANLEKAKEHGAVPFIPFKENTTGKSDGSKIWTEMYDYFQNHRNEFEQHYHKRSNAETGFSMLKRKFGVQLRNKKPVSQRNEILVKCLAHNILVLIQAAQNLGIRPDFDYCADEIFAQE